MKELHFYVSKASEINRRFRGKHIAIIGDRVVASGRSPAEVWRRAKKANPRARPVLAYVPKDDTLVLVFG
ncbi:succinyl-CoA synthetase subunit alpha [Candidatus Bathyarchaeota archaeon]|nr:MAG: succinyl-CoA synthetase subunit alpha [Candidatus Bathyarchaeota archaeon]